MKTPIETIVKACSGHKNARSIRLGAKAAHAHETRDDDDIGIGDTITHLLHFAHFLGLNLRGLVKQSVCDFQVETGSHVLDRYARTPFCTCASDPLIVYTVAVCMAQHEHALAHIQDRLDRIGQAMDIANRYAAWEDRMVCFDDNETVWADELTNYFADAYAALVPAQPLAWARSVLTDAQCRAIFELILQRLAPSTGGIPRIVDPGMSTD